MSNTKIEFTAAATKNLEAFPLVERAAMVASDLLALRCGRFSKNVLMLVRLDAAGLDCGGTGKLDAAKLEQAQGWAEYAEALAQHS